MAKLWDKFLVVRRDGTIPEWPYFVLSARDPATPSTLRFLADEYERLGGYDPEYIADIRQLADEWVAYRKMSGDGDPDAGPHRPDDPEVVNRIPKTGGTIKFRIRKSEED